MFIKENATKIIAIVILSAALLLIITNFNECSDAIAKLLKL